MNPRTTGILILVAAALGAFVYLYEIEGEEQRAETEAAQKRLFPEVEADAITSLSLTTRDGIEARLERSDGTWSLAEPLRFPADAFAADGLASNLAGLSSEAVLEDPQPPEEYGLGDGARVVRFSAGDQAYTLRLGAKTPIGSNAYAQVEGSPEIVTVASFKAQSFDKSLTDLRERKVLDFDTSAIHGIEARWHGDRVVLERVVAEDGAADAEGEDAAADPAGGGPRWRLTEPLEGRADDEAVDRLLSDLSFLRAEGFVDEPSEELLARFDQPDYEVVLRGEAAEDGSAPSWRFALGPVHDGDKRLVRGAERSLYAIPAERASDFPREVVAFRFKRLSEFQIGDASQIDFFFQPAQGDPVAITAERSEDGWTSSPEALAEEKIPRMLTELSSLDAAGILTENANEAELAKLGLAPPNTIVSVFGAAPEAEQAEGAQAAEQAPASLPRLAEIHIGNVEGSEWILARAAGDPVVYRLSYEFAEHLPVSLDALRNRFLAGAEPEPAAPPGEGEGEPLSPSQESP